jgi:nucleoside-diphosphate-sugar epimerase
MHSCVALIGGSGFIGSHFIRQYAHLYEKIVVMDLRPSTKLVADVVEKHRDKIAIIAADISDPLDVMDGLKLCNQDLNTIYMLAAILPNQAERSPGAAFKVNIYGLHNVLEAARILKAKQVIFPSSMTIYSPGEESVTEESRVDPSTVYGATKIIGEIWGIKYAQKGWFKFKALRFPAVIGPGRADGGLMAYASLAIQKAAQGESYTMPVSPSTKASIIYVKDAVKALREISLHDAPSHIYNISGVEPTPSAGELVEVIKYFIPDAEIDFKPNEIYDKIISSWPKKVDSTRAQREWGWKASYVNIYDLVKDFINEIKLNLNIYRV